MTPDTRPANPDVPREVLEDALSAPRRRRIVRTLLERGEPVPLADLAAAVRASELETEAAAVPHDECRAVLDDLYDTHLPKLTATGLVEYDSMRGTVEPGPTDAADLVA